MLLQAATANSDVIIPAVVGLLGVVVGALLSWWVEQRSRRKELAFEMHREYTGEHMTGMRSAGLAILMELGDRTYSKLAEDPVTIVRMQPLMEVLWFFQRLHLAIKHDMIRKDLVVELFGSSFAWWYVGSFRQQLADGSWNEAGQMKALHEWMQADAARSGAPYAKWIRDGEEQRKKIIPGGAGQVTTTQ